MCDSRKYPYPPNRRSLEILREWGSQKYEELEFLELGGGGGREGGRVGYKPKTLPWGEALCATRYKEAR